MAFGWDDGAALALLAGDFVYHRWIEDKPKPQPAHEVTLPRVDDGSPYPIIYGRCRVRAPIPAWCSDPVAVYQTTDTSGLVYINENTWLYFMNMLFVLGIGFDGTGVNNGSNKIYTMYGGDAALARITPSNANLSDLDGNGNFEDGGVSGSAGHRLCVVGTPSGFGDWSQGAVEFLNGLNPSQQLVNTTTPFAATTEAGKFMSRDNAGTGGAAKYAKYNGSEDPSLITGYRGLMCAFLYNDTPTIGDASNPTVLYWLLGSSPTVPQYSFEVASYPDDTRSLLTYLHTVPEDGDQGDVNPAAVVYDILIGTNGKLGLDPNRIDIASFEGAAYTLWTEGHGFARAFEGGTSAGDMLQEIMRQIDGVLREDPTTGLISLKLIRNDYDPTSLLQINPSNCEKLTNAALGTPTGVPNKIRVTFQDRQDAYTDKSGMAHNEANAVGMDGEVRELVLAMPGICTQKLANATAARELAARSRSMFKCSAIVDRTFSALLPGDVVKVLWPEYGLSNVVFRVANVDRGSLATGKITLNLIQDYYYVWRNQPPSATTYPPLKSPGGSIGF